MSQTNGNGASPWRDSALSALADGEAGAAEIDALLRQGEPAALRGRWHAYQLIGDSLRSTELAQDGRRTQALLERLRPQLAAEPVPLRPPAPSARRWFAPAAVAAGFMSLAVGLSSLTSLRDPAADARLAVLPPAPVSATMPWPTQSGLSFAQSAAAPGAAPLLGFDEAAPPAAAAASRPLP
ncbi:sigma-E factor negative regulatory protein [Roseateles sp. DAIF2]|uniref:sigma-E factor negative regulatory protein n=1 Tax=Roseateles sp. DAIF2 TaxID=2714952 RepID=UPI0018A2F063|nr:sigma-E factor negative regulatory protein [Roseateles sp. DAIF2]QPF72760.1 sigma-E factor negative regulatory protein [Roseateles sp. DAIF2]